MSSPRLYEFWKALQARLDTAAVLETLNTGRTFVVGIDKFDDFRGPEGKPWGYQVVQPISSLWPTAEISDFYRPVSFNVKSLMTDFGGRVQALEKLQDIVYTQLHEWTPPKYSRVLVNFKLYRQRPPQVLPEWDEDIDLWWLSSQFGTEAAAPALV
jgi:hypothetical protein